MIYDDQNIFAKILRGEIPCDKVYEDKYCLAFKDINPLAALHILIIPKGAYISMDDFSQNASDQEIASLIRGLGKVARDMGVDQSGYRIIANHGKDAFQEVLHLHFHIFGKQKMQGMLRKVK